MTAAASSDNVDEIKAMKNQTLLHAFSQMTAEWAPLLIEDARTRKCVAITFAMLTTMALSRVIVIPLLLQMLIYTVPTIAFGSYLALNLRVEKLEDIADGNQPKNQGEILSSREALFFPVLASLAILGLYLAYKYLPAKWVNLIMAVYVSAAGIYSIGETVAECWKIMVPTTGTGLHKVINFPRLLHWLTGPQCRVTLSNANVIGGILGVGIALGWLATKAWLLHNLFALAFCIQAIRLTSMGTFKTATFLLVGLFFYDVFWVFKTDVMVTVAKSFEAPAKLLFPISQNPERMSLLGLGDIVVPGFLIAMTLRFDYSQHVRRLQENNLEVPDKFLRPMDRSFKKFYFTSAMISYACSLLLTGVVMLLWKAAQPALFYLVPSLFVSLYIPALFRGDMSALLAYTEADDESTVQQGDEEDEEEEEDMAPQDGGHKHAETTASMRKSQ